MKPVYVVGPVFLLLLSAGAVPAADQTSKRSPKEALKAFNDLIGNWRGTGEPSGTREEKRRGFWVEKIAWEWQFKGDDVYLRAVIDKGKHFTGAELRYLPDRDVYQLKARTPEKETLVFEGPLEKQRLTLERKDEKRNETQRLVFSLLHFNRHLYRYDVKAAGRAAFAPVFQVGATKEGVEFAGDDGKPECVVSGGLGTMPVTYKGKTYYVCCTGCREAFQEEPEKYVKEFEERQKKKRAGK